MQQAKIMEMLAECGAIITDSHIVYTSGKHGSAYINKDAVYPHTELISRLCGEIEKSFRVAEFDVVVGPTIGGVILSQWVAFHRNQNSRKLRLDRKTLAVFAEKQPDGSFAFTRGYDKLIPRKNVLVVEDILNTGGSAAKVVELVKKTGGKVVGVGALANRGGVTSGNLRATRLEALVNIIMDAYDPDDCPLCAQDVPINTTIGKGKDFLAQRARSA